TTLHAEPVWIAIAATLLFVAIGWMLGQKEDWLRHRASTDPLTGVANRRCFDQALARSASECSRTGAPLALLFVDVDQLKAINDELGHAAGDTALRLLPERLPPTYPSTALASPYTRHPFL